MTTRRRFSSAFKAKVALEALRGDRTIQEISARNKVHPNQVRTWKRQAMDGLGKVFSNGPDKARMDHDEEVNNLHAKIGQLTPAEAYGADRPMDMMDKPNGLRTSPQAQQHQKAFINGILAA